MKKKVIIVGAGPAGLTAAYQLLKSTKDYDVMILEADSMVGGIAKTVTYQGNKMDLGGHRFFSKNQKINDLWQEIMSSKDKTKSDLLVQKRVSHIYYLNKFFDYPVSLNFKTIKNLGFVNTVVAFFSYLKSKIFKKEETNLENFYINRFGKKLYSMFFKGYTEKLWGRDPKDITAEWGSQRVKGISITKVITAYLKKLFHIKDKKIETSFIDQFLYPKYGPGEMWEQLASEITAMGGNIILNAKVIALKQSNHRITKVVYNQDGKSISKDVDILISSMPIKDLIESLNQVPKKITKIAKDLPYRDFMTVGILTKKVNFEGRDMIDDTWIYIQEENIKMGRIQIFNNWSSYLVKDKNCYSLGLEYFCDEGDKLWNLTDDEFYEFAVKELEKMNIVHTSDIVLHHVERVKKAYPAYFDSYQYIDDVKDYLDTIVNLYCIGRNGQHHYNNMDHSMLTAIEAINNIISGKDTKENIWNVNTEKEYMEETIHEKNSSKNKK